jgi:hypothetical protein
VKNVFKSVFNSLFNSRIVCGPVEINSIACRLLELADGSYRIESFAKDRWIARGCSLRDFAISGARINAVPPEISFVDRFLTACGPLPLSWWKQILLTPVVLGFFGGAIYAMVHAGGVALWLLFNYPLVMVVVIPAWIYFLVWWDQTLENRRQINPLLPSTAHKS